MVSVEGTAKEPYYPGDVIIRYTDGLIPWQSSPIQRTEKGSYEISINLSSENYFERTYPITMVIANAADIDFYFNKYFDEVGNFVTSSLTKVTPRYAVEENKYPTAYSTVSSDFVKWYPEDNLEDPDSTRNSVSALYRTKTFTVTYKYDNTIESKKG